MSARKAQNRLVEVKIPTSWSQTHRVEHNKLAKYREDETSLAKGPQRKTQK